MIGVWLLAARLAAPVPEEPLPVKPAGYMLEWEAPTGCPDREAIEARITELAPAPGGGARLMWLFGEVEQTENGYALRLRTEYLDEVDERVLESDTCDELGETTALFVAVALEPALASEREQDAVAVEVPSEPSAPLAEPVEPPQSGETQVSHQSSPPPRPSAVQGRGPLDLALRSGPQLEVGGLVGVTGGPNMAVVAAWPQWRAEVFGQYLLPRRIEGPRSSGGRVRLGAAGVRACYRLLGGPVEFPVCAFVEAGALRVDSEGLEPRNTLHFGWLAPGVGTAIAVRGRRVGFYGGVEAAVAALRSRVFVGDQQIFSTGTISVRVQLGMEIFFAIQRG